MKPTPVSDQVRSLREARFARTRSLVNSRTLPSAAEVKRIADKAQARSPTLARSSVVERVAVNHQVVGSSPTESAKPARKLAELVIATKLVGTEKEIKMSPALATAAQDWDKSKYQTLYMRVKRAKTDEELHAAEAALREAFPNKRPRSGSVALSGVEKKALALEPKIKKQNPLPKPLRSMKAMKRGFNGQKSRKAQRAKKKKGRR